MKRLIIFGFTFLIISLSFSQSAKWATKNYNIVRDSLSVENKAVFCKYKYYNQKDEEDAVKFTLTVTNNGKSLIPDINTARFNQTSGLHIWINGYDAVQMSLANGMFGGDKTLKKGESDSWDWNQQITGPYKADFGDVFTWQWEYMGIKSPIMQVDVVNRTINQVSEHLKSDKVIY